MNNKAVGSICFVIGGAVGVLGSMKYFQNKYKKIADEEIESVRDVMNRKAEEPEYDVEEPGVLHPEDIAARAKNKPDITEYVKTVKKMNYAGFSEQPKEVVEADIQEDAPYVISPEEYGDQESYELITLIYFADGMLADDSDELVEDEDSTVGHGTTERFGEFETDTIYVRNEKLKCDFEILRDRRTYEDVVGLRRR